MDEVERLDAIVDLLEDQRKICEVSKNFRIHFTLEAMRLALGEAEEHLGVDLDWIWETVYEELSKKANTSLRNYIIGYFIHALVLHGSDRKPAIDAVSEWILKSDTSCRDAFHEIQKLSKIEKNSIWFDFDRCGKKEFIEFIDKYIAKKDFPRKNSKTAQAFESLRYGLHNDKRKDLSLSTGVSSAKAQFHSNRDMRQRIADRQK